MNFFNRCFCVLLFVMVAIPVHAADYVYGTAAPWGQLLDPDGDCSFTVRRNAITIGFSGAAHGLDIEGGRMNAPRVVRSMKGDFAVQVTVDGNLPLPDDENVTAYVSGGLVLLQDDRNYIRLERASFTRSGTDNHYANFEQRIDAKRTRMGLFRDYPLSNDHPVDLRLEVKSGIVRALARRTGQPWHEMGTAKVDTDSEFYVGISGVNTSRQPLEVTFRNIQHQHEFAAAEDESSSEIDLASPPKITSLPKATRTAYNKFMTGMNSILRRSKDIDSMDMQARQSLIDDAVKLVSEGDSEVNVRMVPPFVPAFSRKFQTAGDHELAIVVYDKFIAAIEKIDDPITERMIKQLSTNRDGLQFKLSMIGKPLELEGESLSGEPFDWQSYRGKVVLVDFWASWCGPCRREIPNVLKQYSDFHDKGFEVVGVCLDTERDKAEKYITEEELPWPSLFEKDAGWKHPMAVKYKVTAIPTAILVDRNGKVVSLSARGDSLPEQLADLIGPVEPPKKDGHSSESNDAGSDDRADETNDANTDQ